MSRAGGLHNCTISSGLDVVMDTIPDQEAELNQYYSFQLKKLYFVHILLAV
jgi:hypothetical protein